MGLDKSGQTDSLKNWLRRNAVEAINDEPLNPGASSEVLAPPRLTLSPSFRTSSNESTLMGESASVNNLVDSLEDPAHRQLLESSCVSQLISGKMTLASSKLSCVAQCLGVASILAEDVLGDFERWPLSFRQTQEPRLINLVQHTLAAASARIEFRIAGFVGAATLLLLCCLNSLVFQPASDAKTRLLVYIAVLPLYCLHSLLMTIGASSVLGEPEKFSITTLMEVWVMLRSKKFRHASPKVQVIVWVCAALPAYTLALTLTMESLEDSSDQLEHFENSSQFSPGMTLTAVTTIVYTSLLPSISAVRKDHVSSDIIFSGTFYVGFTISVSCGLAANALHPSNTMFLLPFVTTYYYLHAVLLATSARSTGWGLLGLTFEDIWLAFLVLCHAVVIAWYLHTNNLAGDHGDDDLFAILLAHWLILLTAIALFVRMTHRCIWRHPQENLFYFKASCAVILGIFILLPFDPFLSHGAIETSELLGDDLVAMNYITVDLVVSLMLTALVYTSGLSEPDDGTTLGYPIFTDGMLVPIGVLTKVTDMPNGQQFRLDTRNTFAWVFLFAIDVLLIWAMVAMFMPRGNSTGFILRFLLIHASLTQQR